MFGIQSINLLSSRPTLPKVEPDVSTEFLIEFYRPLLWLVEDLFWSKMATRFHLLDLSLNIVLNYYHSIRRFQVFGLGRAWALGADKKLLIRLCFGIIIPNYDRYAPYEVECNYTRETEPLLQNLCKDKVKKGYFAIGKKSQGRIFLKHTAVQELKKDRFILELIVLNQITETTSFTMTNPSICRLMPSDCLSITYDLDSSFDHVPIAETCIQSQGIILKYSKEVFFGLAGLQGQNMVPHGHEVTQGYATDLATNVISYSPRFMDDGQLAVTYDNLIRLKFVFEQINGLHLALSPKLKYDLSSCAEFLGTFYDSKTGTHIPAEKHYWKLLRKILVLLTNPRRQTVRQLMQIRGKILSMTNMFTRISTEPIDRLITRAMINLRTFTTYDYELLLNYEIAIDTNVFSCLYQATLILLEVKSTAEQMNLIESKYKLFLVTDAGEDKGAGLVLYSGPPLPTINFELYAHPWVLHFNESERKVMGSSSTSREQHILHILTKNIKGLIEEFRLLNISPHIIIVGDNKGVASRIRNKKCKNFAEDIELKKILTNLNNNINTISAVWTPRTNPLIQLVDELPRPAKDEMMLIPDAIQRLKEHFGINKWIPFLPQGYLTHLHPFTSLIPIRTFYDGGDPYFIFPNPRKTHNTQYFKILLFLIIRQVKCILILPETRQLKSIRTLSKKPFSLTWTDLITNNNSDLKWLDKKRSLKYLAFYFQGKLSHQTQLWMITNLQNLWRSEV